MSLYKRERGAYNKLMIWVRKFLVSLFSAVLLVALVGGVVSYSLNSAFAEPTHSEQWLSQSQLYKQFTANSLSQAVQFTDSNGQVTTIDANDPIIQQALQNAFPEQLANQSVATFLGGNYQWLKGKTDKPQFTIDLTAVKATFAHQIGQAVGARLGQLPICSLSQLRQLSQMQTVDLLQAPCRPPSLNPSVEAVYIEQQITSSGGFLTNPVLTADNLHPLSQPSQSGKPYYTRLHALPHIYQVAQKLPYIFAGLALISLLILLLASQTKRFAWRHLVKILIFAGLVLALGKPVFDAVYNRAQGTLFDTYQTAAWQKSMTAFARSAIDYITHINMVGGIIYLGLALLVVIGLLITRFGLHLGRPAPESEAVSQEQPEQPAEPTTPETPKNQPPSLGGRGSIQ